MNQPFTNTLSPEHAQMITASAISSEVAAARGYRTLTHKSELKALGFGTANQIVPTLLLPIWGIGGEIALYHHRPNTPRLRDGKPAKYEFPPGSRMAIDVHPAIREQARRPDVPLFITEGVRKADAAISAGLCCLSVIGTWNWRGTNEWGGKTALPDWDEIAFKDKHDTPRQVYIVYDSDVMVKESVHLALARLSAFLKHRGAKVSFIYLPHGGNGQKVGLDDYLAGGHTTNDLLALASSILRLPEGSGDKPLHPYAETPSGLIWTRQTLNGPQETPLTNFTALIVADIVEDDGAETRRTFEIEARRGGRVVHVTVPAQSFALMHWPMETLGAGALLYPGLSIKDNARAAIQLLSGDPPTRHVYSHTGWRQIEGRWVYLHAHGAIGQTAEESLDPTLSNPTLSDPVSVDPVPANSIRVEPIHVRLPDALSRYALPEPLTGDLLAQALRASLELRNLLPETLAFPLLAAVYRAALGTSDFSLHLAGPSGAFKSELAALAQQHFGAGLDARHLPASWTATDNALEGLAFAVKDALMVVDDFAPSGSGLDVQRLHAKADRLLRGQGNNSGRLRMRADTTLKAPKFPRGLILSTGEDIPAGLSLQARLLVLEVPPGLVQTAALSQCQQDAAQGLYAQALSGFLAWLSPRYAEVREGLTGQKNALRDQVPLASEALQSGSSHRRTPEIAANLGLGLDYFLRCCLENGAISAEEHANFWQRGWAALLQAAAAQSAHQSASEPTQRFLELLAAALSSGRAHLASPKGDVPPLPEAWGWRLVQVGTGENAHDEWRPQGDRVGWLDGDDVFLQKDAAYNAAKKFGAESGDGLSLSPRILHKRLDERGLLASTDKSRRTSTIRRVFSGQRHDVLHLHTRSFAEGCQTGKGGQAESRVHSLENKECLSSETIAQTAHFAQSNSLGEGKFAANGQFDGQKSQQRELETAHTGVETAHEIPLAPTFRQSKPAQSGQNGQFGQFMEEAERETWRP